MHNNFGFGLFGDLMQLLPLDMKKGVRHTQIYQHTRRQNLMSSSRRSQIAEYNWN